jgi:glycosyltransferase involved in cell wall biosynthesis
MLDPYYKLYRWKHVQKAICWALAEHRTVRDAAAVFFTSEEEMLRARNSFRPYSCKEAVVGLGIVTAPGDAAWDIEEFFTSFPDLRAKRLLLHLGRLHPKKGCDLLVRAFAEIARDNEDLHLVLAGPDECGMGSALKQLVRNLCPPASVTFTGPLSGSLKWGAFRAAEALVLPSHNENYGIVVVEALACGTPALISDQVAIWREVTEDSAGMADSDTLEGTIRLLRRWLALSLYERRVMQRAARTSFEKRYELSTSIRKLLAKLNEPSRSPQLLNTR